MHAYAHAHVPSQWAFRAGDFISWHTLQRRPCSIHTEAPSPQKWSVTPTGLLFEAIKDRDLMRCKRVLLGADCLPEGISSKITMFYLPIERQTRCGSSRA